MRPFSSGWQERGPGGGLLVGTILSDRYRIDAELGRGGMSVVYRAHDMLLARDVAVKVLSATALDAGNRARLLHEARSAASLNHPNIVTVHDVGEVDGVPFLVSELVEGKPLHDQPPKALDDILSIVRQVCAALEHAHAQGIVHRDLKPENVLITPGGVAKLSDFGLARSLASRLTSEGTIVGTVFYLAPELALGQAFDARADLYALGVMLYELTTGELPFTADDPVAVISQHLYAVAVPPRAKNADIPPALDALIVRLLNKDPGGRPGSAADVLRILNAPDILDKEALPAEELSVLERIERGRLVGRERELQQAKGLWNSVLSGQGQMLLISGEPGIGKTRLVQELSAQVQISGGRALVGACYAEGGVPYAPFAQILRAVLGQGAGQDLDLPDFVLSDLLTLAPGLQLRYPELTPGPTLQDPQTQQYRIFENLIIFFTALSGQAPLLVVVEDIHWADSGTLSLLRHLARHLRRQRVLFVATYQGVELDESRTLQEVLLDLHRERLTVRLKLLRLDREQTRELLAVLFAEEITPEFLEGIYRETEGNPFFIEEVCKALVESGRLYYDGGRWHRPSVDELGIPQSVRVAIQSRLRVLPGAARGTLRLAAVMGRTFELDALVAASDLDEGVVVDALEYAQRAQLLEELHGERATREPGVASLGFVFEAPHENARSKARRAFAFVHGLIPSTLVKNLSPTQRRRLHGRVAASIESLHRADFEALAYHYDQAGDAEKAVHYLLKAGDRARALYACREAIDHYQRALALLQEQGDCERAARTLMRLGLVYTAAFEPDKARQAYDQAFDLWEPLRQSTDLPEQRGTVTVLHFAVEEPLTLDPGMMADDVSSFMAAQLFEGLVKVDPVYNVLPAVAARWKVADQGRRYLFRLQEGLRWSDGHPLTAGDFEYAWKRNLSLAPRASVAHLLYVIENARAVGEGEIDDPQKVGVIALDDLTLEVRLEQPTAYLPHLLAHAVAYPLPRWVVKGHEGDWSDPESFVGNGAYRLVEWQRGAKLVLGKNRFYQGPFPGNIERVECPILADYQSALGRYAASALDAVAMINAGPGAIARARVAHGRELVLTPQPSTLYLAFRADRSPFDDVRVRRAFVHAVDRGALVREASEGQYLPANGGFLPPGMPAHSAGIGLAYDAERARDLLAQAGYPGGHGFPTVSWLHSGGSAGEPIVPFLQRAWREKLGLELQAQSTEWGAFMERRDHDPSHLALAGWTADYPDPDSLLRVLFHSREGVNPIRWHNARFDALVEEAARIADPSRRMALYQEADRILVSEEAAIMPLCYAQGRILIKPWVTMPRVPPALLRLQEVILQREEC
jgi:oligopeptide transport system substrate-binding protein